MNPLDLAKLAPLIARTLGKPEMKIGLIDGPVDTSHPELAGNPIHALRGKPGGVCIQANSAACLHGTFVAGVLCAKRGLSAPAICPGCTLLVRPVFPETRASNGQIPSTAPGLLAAAIIECIEAGARIINLSLAIALPSPKGDQELSEALDYAARSSVIIVAAAGNQRTVGGSAITRHPWVIPVVAYDLRGRPMDHSNLGSSLGKRGLGAPGDHITSLGPESKPLTLGGTSVAAPFVTGAIALLWCEFPNATATEVKMSVTKAYASQRRMIVPPLLDAWEAYQSMARGDVRSLIA